jgi:predicted DNA-binding transcriptional regulator AlpA
MAVQQTTFQEIWDVVCARWKAQDIKKDEVTVKMGISKATLYRMEKRRGIKESQTASD